MASLTSNETQRTSRGGAPPGPFDSSRILASLIPGIVAWLFTGGIAIGYERFVAEELAWMMMAMCIMAQGLSALFTLINVDRGWPGRGMQMFASGAAGFGITTAGTFALARSIGVGTVFWSMSGIYVGWLAEALLRPVGRLTTYMNSIAPARQGEEAIGLQPVTPGYDLVDAYSPKNSLEEGRNQSESRPL